MGKNAQIKLPWADIPVLLALMRCSSMAAAGRELGLDRTTVARRLERLESQLGMQLFERQSGNLVPTDQGRHILSIAERAEQELSDLQPSDSERRFKYGKVRISLSEHVLAAFSSQLNAFIHEQPELFLELSASNQLVNLSKYEADIVLRIGRTPSKGLHTIDLGAVHFALYRLKGETGPLQIFWPRAGQVELPKLVRQKYPQAKAVAAVDGVLPTREMILAGGGAGILPKFLGDQDDRLVTCSDDILVEKYRLFIGCLHEQRNLHRIRLVMQQLGEKLKKTLAE